MKLDYSIRLHKSIKGVHLISWREPKKRTQYFNLNYVPYALAIYLRLMPQKDGVSFTNFLYDFDHDALDNIKTDGIIQSVKSVTLGKILRIKGDV